MTALRGLTAATHIFLSLLCRRLEQAAIIFMQDARHRSCNDRSDSALSVRVPAAEAFLLLEPRDPGSQTVARHW